MQEVKLTSGSFACNWNADFPPTPETPGETIVRVMKIPKYRRILLALLLFSKARLGTRNFLKGSGISKFKGLIFFQSSRRQKSLSLSIGIPKKVSAKYQFTLLQFQWGISKRSF